MVRQGEPPLTDHQIRVVIAQSNALTEAATPKSKEVVQDPLHPHGIFKPAEPDLVDIKRKLAQKEAERQAEVDKRLEKSRAQAKKNSPIFIVDVG